MSVTVIITGFKCFKAGVNHIHVFSFFIYLLIIILYFVLES